MAIIGILGGMGPMATVDVFQKIVSHTPADCDQEHIRIIIDNNPKIPSRIDAIINGTESPLQELINSARLLEMCGADFIIIPCNTAHYWFDELQEVTSVEIVHMIDNAVAHIKNCDPELSGKILLLATAATVQTGLYENAFTRQGIALITPDAEGQQLVSNVINEIKAGHIADNSYREQLIELLNRYASQGVKACIGACTELPLIFPYVTADLIKYDPTDLLARRAVAKALAAESQ